jgi:uncharacterized protein (DUF2252 family)
MITSMDAFAWAARQIELDRFVAERDVRLAARKLKRVSMSPLGFFRGSAPLFYELWASGRGLENMERGGAGALVGDMHLENVGAYRTDDDAVTFGLNDFDDANRGPLWLDVVRLATSVLLAGRSFSASGSETLSLVRVLLTAYRESLFGREGPREFPVPVAALCDRARKRTRKMLLDERAPEIRGKRMFMRGERYFDLSQEELAAMPALVASFRDALGARAPHHAKTWTVIDTAFRIAGTGSLGRRRYALLLGSQDGNARIFEFKEEGPSSTQSMTGPSPISGAQRVVEAAFALTSTPPRQLAALPPHPLGSFIGRKLSPEEDKLDLATMHMGPKLSSVVGLVGNLLGHAHRRAADRMPEERDHDDEIVDAAVRFAGDFEAISLAHARLNERAHLT